MINRLMCVCEKNIEVINYIIFGVLTTLINLMTYFILTFTLFNVENGFELQIVNVISWNVAVVFAYVTNRKYVFYSQNEDKKKELFDFFLARLITLFVDMVIMYFGVNALKFSDKIVKIISQITVIVGNYFLSKIFVFKKNKSKSIIVLFIV